MKVLCPLVSRFIDVAIGPVWGNAVWGPRQNDGIFLPGLFWNVNRGEEFDAVPHRDSVFVFFVVLAYVLRFTCRALDSKQEEDRDESNQSGHADIVHRKSERFHTLTGCEIGKKEPQRYRVRRALPRPARAGE
jgi:Na+-transporting methylmalonyl-CoA/oxaloacetate decarboxylase gamma subunit